MVAPFAWCVECLAGHPVSPLGSTFARVGRYLRLRGVWDVCVCLLAGDSADLVHVMRVVAPPLKTLAVAVWGVVVIAYQAGAGSAGLTGAWGELIAVVFGALSSAGVIAFLRKWWERRQLREEQAQDAQAAKIERLEYDLQTFIGYSNLVYGAAVAAGVKDLVPPPTPTRPPPRSSIPIPS